jgi:transposase
VMEASFGWGWLSDLLEEAGMDVHLSNCYKVEQMRFRADLVELQTQAKNRIHAVSHRHGIFHEFSDLFGAKGRKFLAELCRDNPANLPAEALLALRGQVKLLDQKIAVQNE